MASVNKVMALSNRGFTASEIDDELGLPRGEARRTMVSAWARDKRRGGIAPPAEGAAPARR